MPYLLGIKYGYGINFPRGRDNRKWTTWAALEEIVSFRYGSEVCCIVYKKYYEGVE